MNIEHLTEYDRSEQNCERLVSHNIALFRRNAALIDELREQRHQTWVIAGEASAMFLAFVVLAIVAVRQKR